MFEINDRGKGKLFSNTTDRRIYLYVNALSSRNWRSLRRNLCTKLTEIGMAEMIVPLIVSLGRFIVQHDVLHETCFHKQDVIYRLMYGSFLQPIQVHLGIKGLNSDPVKRVVQKHKNMLLLVALAARRHQFNRFLKQWTVDSANDSLPKIEFLMQTHRAYLSYCITQEDCEDKPTRIVALFLKYMDGYMRSFYAVKHCNSWLLEQEGHDWLPGFKITGKRNYVTEGCHRIHMLYGRDVPTSHGLPDEELEWTRCNRQFTMSNNGDSMNLDKVNKLLNLWNKEMVMSPCFKKVCKHSRYVMFHRSCQMNVFGVANRRSSRTSNQYDVARLTAYFKRADIFLLDASTRREMHKDFF